MRSKIIDQYEFILRSAVKSDSTALARLDQECFNIPWSEQSFEADLADSQKCQYLVWEVKNAGSNSEAECENISANEATIIGYGGFWQILGDAEIMNIAVHPAWRRLNLAGELLECLIEIARKSKISTMTLEVRTSNNAAISLYRKFGFEQSGIRLKYYADNGENAIIMLKKIPII